ncbi:MAG TPA: hypothetical protein DEQ32_02815, partial [Gammaproteobacteria bacterium]|nr:hypothetical protein [Gammaproteobacteria bacterium]
GRISGSGSANLYLASYGGDDEVVISRGKPAQLNESGVTFSMPVPSVQPVFEIGVELPEGGVVFLDYLSWSGEPEVTFRQPDTPKGKHPSAMWRRAWVNGVDELWTFAESFRLMQNEGRGLIVQGTRDWRNYTVTADVTPHMAKAAGIAARVQGMRRYYGLLIGHDKKVRLIKMVNEESILASADFNWSFGDTIELSLTVDGDKIIGVANGVEVLKTEDSTLACGGIALIAEEGRTATNSVRVNPA